MKTTLLLSFRQVHFGLLNASQCIAIVILAICGLSYNANAQVVNIPDANFKAALVSLGGINTNGDGEIQNSEAAAFTGQIYVQGLSISDLTGIEAFTALLYLDCAWNQLTSLNLSANTTLAGLECNFNQLTSLTLPSNTALTYLRCGGNQLTSLNVSANTALTTLVCSGNLLTSLNLSSNTFLYTLICDFNQLTSLTLPADTALTYLNCGHNQLTSLNVSANTALTDLDCYNNLLTSLNLSANSALTQLDCYENQLTSLNVSANTALTQLYCYSNLLTSLDLSSNTALTQLYCYSNQLISLNVKNGNNINFSYFEVGCNFDLSCIQVDNATYMNTNWANSICAGAIYSENCSVGITSKDVSISTNIYPNPSVSGIFNIEINKNTSNNSLIIAYDVTGRKVLEKICNTGNCILNMNGFATGIYTLVINTEKLTISRRIVITERAVQ